MSDETTPVPAESPIDPPYEPSEAEEYAYQNRVANTDHFLQSLVDLTNSNETFALDVTLTIGGTIVTGRMVSGLKYFDAISAYNRSGLEGADDEMMRKYYDSFTAVYSMGDPTDPNKPGPRYIHLENARYQKDGGFVPTPPGEGMWWRGKIEAVDAFSFGMLSAGEPS